MTSIESIKLNSDKDPSLHMALEKYPGFLTRLEGVMCYDDIISAVERAAVDDGTGEMVVYDLDGYEDGYEDEEIEVSTVSLEKLKNAIEFIRDNGVSHYEEIRELTQHIPTRNAIVAIWATELPLTEEQIIKE